MEQTLPALIKLKEAGKVKMVGLTGYPLSLQKKIIEAFPGKLDTCLTYCAEKRRRRRRKSIAMLRTISSAFSSFMPTPEQEQP